MEAHKLSRLIEESSTLSDDERWQLMTHLLEQMRKRLNASGHSRSWMSIRGAAQHPLTGDDAQQWVSSGRTQADCSATSR